MVPIRRVKAKAGDFGPDPVLDLPQAAHLKIKSAKLFPPKVDEDTGSFWVPNVSLRLLIVDDRTEEGDADGLEFSDRFELKIDEELGIEDEDLKTKVFWDFTKEERALLLDIENWTIRKNTKLDKLMIALDGPSWTHFEVDELVEREYIAKVTPRTGKRPGSYCVWESFMSIEPPKKKRKSASQRSTRNGKASKTAKAKAQTNLEETEREIEADLSEADEKDMKAALG
jgi:hypothetical protein